MPNEKRDYGSLIIALVAIALQAAAWIWPNAPIEARITASILSIVITLFSQQSGYEGIRAWLRALLTFLLVNYPLVLAVLLSGVSILLIPTQPQPELAAKAVLIMAAILAASLSGLVLKFSRQPSVRVVKGSSDETYLIVDGIKRHIPDPQTHEFIMLDTYRSTERISDLELRLHPTGKPLPNLSDCRLVKGGSPAIYVIWEGHRKHIPDGPTFEHFFKGRPFQKLSDAELEKIPRTGALRTILAGIGGASIIINGDVYWDKGLPDQASTQSKQDQP